MRRENDSFASFDTFFTTPAVQSLSDDLNCGSIYFVFEEAKIYEKTKSVELTCGFGLCSQSVGTPFIFMQLGGTVA